MKINIERLANHDGIAAVLAVPYDGTRADIREVFGPLDLPALPSAFAVRVLLATASLPEVGRLRCTLDAHGVTVVLATNDDAREAVAVVIQTDHPVVKSLRRSIKRCWSSVPVRRSLAGLTYPSARAEGGGA